MSFIGYQCYRCGAEHPRDFSGYTCPSCGGNLEVTYDWEKLKKEVPREKLVDVARPDIFRYLRMLPIERLELASPLRVGMTPLYHAKELGAAIGQDNIFIKDEGLNPSGSLKDRASAVALVRARETDAKVIAGASTGNAGSSMACLSASVGLPCVILVPDKAPPAKMAQLLVFGAHVLTLRGTYDDAYDLCLKACEAHHWFNRNTGYNPFTREGKKTCAYEICEQMGWQAPDRIIVPTGDGNIISSIWKGMRDLQALGLIDRLPKLDCAQAAGSAAIGLAAVRVRHKSKEVSSIKWPEVKIEAVEARTLADSISVDNPRDGLAAVRAILESGGEVVSVDDEDILEGITDIGRLAGVFAEPAAASTWACLKKLVRENIAKTEDRIVLLITGSGLKDVQSARRAVGSPTMVDPEVDSVEKAVGRLKL